MRHGLIDHADSMGATARFGHGDTQWMTAGKGVQHCEMFPLVNKDSGNLGELFQIWLNLPAADKMVDPYFTMLWNERTPKVQAVDAAGVTTEITVIAGSLGETAAPTPPPNSWASKPDADLAVWHIRIEAGGRWTLPQATNAETLRVLYAFEGSSVQIGTADPVAAHTGAAIVADRDLELVAGDGGIEMMLLQGRPIGEPVAQHGPFVMNTRAEIVQAFEDYRRTEFGGWPWPSPDPNHGPDAGRFAIHGRPPRRSGLTPSRIDRSLSHACETPPDRRLTSVRQTRTAVGWSTGATDRPSRRRDRRTPSSPPQ